MSLIINSVYLGSFQDATNLQFLQQNNVQGIVSCCTIFDFPLSAKHPDLFEYLPVEVEDIGTEPISAFFDETVEFIDRIIKKKSGAVLIHCKSGVSRSATMTIAYLILSQSLSLGEAFSLVKEKRPIIRPNIGFMNQLCDLEVWIAVRGKKAAPEFLQEFNQQKTKPLLPRLQRRGTVGIPQRSCSSSPQLARLRVVANHAMTRRQPGLLPSAAPPLLFAPSMGAVVRRVNLQSPPPKAIFANNRVASCEEFTKAVRLAETTNQLKQCSAAPEASAATTTSSSSRLNNYYSSDEKNTSSAYDCVSQPCLSIELGMGDIVNFAIMNERFLERNIKIPSISLDKYIHWYLEDTENRIPCLV